MVLEAQIQSSQFFYVGDSFSHRITRATKEIAKRYGGLEDLGEKLMKSENFEMAPDEIVWLIVLLANQSVLIHNLQNAENRELQFLGLAKPKREYFCSALKSRFWKNRKGEKF